MHLQHSCDRSQEKRGKLTLKPIYRQLWNTSHDWQAERNEAVNLIRKPHHNPIEAAIFTIKGKYKVH